MLNTSGFLYMSASHNDGSNKARIKMEQLIERGQASGAQVIEQVTSRVVQDSIVRGKSLAFAPNGSARTIDLIHGETVTAMHKNAFSQMSARAGLHVGDMNDLMDKGDWGKELVADVFTKIFQHGNGTRYLLRQAEGKTMGFLSDAYRRIDSRPLIEALATAAQSVGAVPVQGYAGDTKVMLRIILPMLFEPIRGEYHLFGLDWRNSDFGDGGHELRFFDMRVACANGATFDQILKQVHIGQRLNDNLEYSRRTYELDSKADAGKLQDIVRLNALAPSNINRLLGGIVKANEQKIDNEKQAKGMLGKALTKTEVDKVIDLYNSPDVENLPPGNTAYRLSNAISFFAQNKSVTPERSLEMQQLAGNLLK